MRFWVRIGGRPFLSGRTAPADVHKSWYTADEMAGRHLLQFLHAEDVGAVRDSVRAGRKKAMEIHDFEIRILCKDGSTRWLSWNALSKGGKWFANARDITRRREIEAKWNESHQRLLETQAIARLGSWELDVETYALTWSSPVRCRRPSKSIYNGYIRTACLRYAKKFSTPAKATKRFRWK